jgi:4-amino-4-deoxy-L-arabinose transferase-like glycosyltransferase
MSTRYETSEHLPMPHGPTGPAASVSGGNAAVGAQGESDRSLDGRVSSPDPRWVRPTLWGLLAVTAILYLWGLSASGWANSYYSAAVQAMADNWTAFFFGSSDMANSITVDKPPASLWVMALSVKAFGLNSWSILVPQALMGVASVGVLYATVRRWFGGVAGLIAGAVLALTPVAALMFRYNNPDALLVLLLLVAAYAVVRATEVASPKWLALAGFLVGIAFLTKSLQAFLVLPAFFAVYLIAAPTGPGKRVRDLAIAFAVMVVSLGWWIAIVELWPADSRPYIGGSEDNSVLNLIFGYNGFGRITGDEPGAVTGGADGAVAGGAGGAGGGQWGETGWSRLFDPSWAGGIAWLLPVAFVLLAVGLWLTRGQSRTGRVRAGFVLWGGWLLVTWATFSFSSGIIHEYYAIALAPAIAAVVAMGSVLMWQLRSQPAVSWGLAGILAGSALYGAYLLSLAGGMYTVLGAVVVALGLAGSAGLIWGTGRLTAVAATVGLAAVLLGPAAFTVQTASSAATGSLPSAGPTLAGAQTRGPGGGPGGQGGPGGLGGPSGLSQDGGQTGQLPGFGTDGQAPGGDGQLTGPGFGSPSVGDGVTPDGTGTLPDGAGPGTATDGGGIGTGAGGPGGLLDATAPSDELVSVLNADSDDYVWVAAAVGSQTGAGYQLGTGNSVMPIGGFNGSDPSPTLAQFQQYVADGDIHWFIAGDSFGPGAGTDSTSSQISDWVEENFDPITVDGTTLYEVSAS